MEVKLISLHENSTRLSRLVLKPYSIHEKHTKSARLHMEAEEASHDRTQCKHNKTESEDNEEVSWEIARVKNRVNTMERKLHGVIAKSDKKAIRFMGLGF